MNLITAGTRIQAAHYAAALRLTDSEWTYYTDPSQIQGAQGAFHVLPGAPHGAAEAARSNARHFDHSLKD